jgi:hypothetical protein
VRVGAAQLAAAASRFARACGQSGLPRTPGLPEPMPGVIGCRHHYVPHPGPQPEWHYDIERREAVAGARCQHCGAVVHVTQAQVQDALRRAGHAPTPRVAAPPRAPRVPKRLRKLERRLAAQAAARHARAQHALSERSAPATAP